MTISNKGTLNYNPAINYNLMEPLEILSSYTDSEGKTLAIGTTYGYVNSKIK